MTLSKEQMGASHPDLNALAAFTDQRLTGTDRAALVAHLAGCEQCRTILAAMARAQSRRAPSAARVWLPIAATVTLTVAAGILATRLNDREPTTRDLTVPVPTTASPAPAPLPAPTTPPSGGVAPPGQQPDPPTTRRGGRRIVDGKTFTLVAGEWIDASYDPVNLLPVQDLADAAARTALLQRTPALAPYAALGPNVTVVFGGTVYRFRR